MQVQLVKCLSLSVVFGQAPSSGNVQRGRKIHVVRAVEQAKGRMLTYVVPYTDYFLGIFILLFLCIVRNQSH